MRKSEKRIFDTMLRAAADQRCDAFCVARLGEERCSGRSLRRLHQEEIIARYEELSRHFTVPGKFETFIKKLWRGIIREQ